MHENNDDGDDVDVHESEDIGNATPPSLLLQMASNTVPVAAAQPHNLHNHQSFNARPLAQQSRALPTTVLPALTSNGYVTHNAIIGKVCI